MSMRLRGGSNKKFAVESFHYRELSSADVFIAHSKKKNWIWEMNYFPNVYRPIFFFRLLMHCGDSGVQLDKIALRNTQSLNFLIRKVQELLLATSLPTSQCVLPLLIRASQ